MLYKLILTMTATNLFNGTIQAALYDSQMLVDGLDSEGTPDECLVLALDIVDRIIVSPQCEIEVLFVLLDNRSQGVSIVDHLFRLPRLPDEAKKAKMIDEIQTRFDHMRKLGVPTVRTTLTHAEQSLPF